MANVCQGFSDEIETVKRIYRAYAADNASLSDIAKTLTAEGIPCAGKKGWDSVAVSRILHNPIYARCNLQIYLYFEHKGVKILNSVSEFDGKKAAMLVGKRDRGKGRYNGTDEQQLSLAMHAGVIDAQLWLKCQDKLDRNSQIKNSGAGKHSWLTGLIKCGNCGYGIRVVANNGRRYLVCSGKTNYHVCNKSYAGVDLAEIENEVFEEMKRMFADNSVEISHNSKVSVNEILEIDKKIDRLVAAIGEGTVISIKYINRELERLEKEKSKLMNRGVKEKNIPKTIYRFDPDNLTMDEKRQLAGELIERIEINDNDVTVIWKI